MSAAESIITHHGLVHWDDSHFRVHSNELVYPPEVLSDITGECMAHALSENQKSSAVPLNQMLGSAFFKGFVVSTDASSTNCRAMKLISENSSY